MSKFALLFSDNYDAASDEVAATGGRVTQKFTDAVFEALLPDSADATSLRCSSTTAPAQLDDVSQMMAEAWNLHSGVAAEEPGRDAGGTVPTPWDAPGRQPPWNAGNDPALAPASGQSVGFDGAAATPAATVTPTSAYMTGRVYIGYFLVQGTAPGLGFNLYEQTQIMSQLQQGLQFLANAEPSAGLHFIWFLNSPTVNAPPPTGGCPSTEACEKIWRDPALEAIGYPPGLAGCEAYAAKLQTGADSAFLAFVTKYPMLPAAYASGPRLCMQYNGTGMDLFGLLFAHLVCNLFGAADESGTCGCGPSGAFLVPNNNCRNCTQIQIPCMMNSPTWSLCPWSRGQLGWSTWLPVPGPTPFADISCARDKTVWGVATNGDVYNYAGSAWQKIEGGLARVSVGSAANIWGINSAGHIFQWVNSSWQSVEGGLTDISAAADGTVWGVNQNGTVLRYTGSGWDLPVPGSTMKRIAVGSAKIVWALGPAGEIFKYDGSSWQAIAGPVLTDIAAAADGSVWGVGSPGAVFRYSSSTWQPIGGPLSQIAVGSQKTAWGVDPAGNAYRRLFAATAGGFRP